MLLPWLPWVDGSVATAAVSAWRLVYAFCAYGVVLGAVLLWLDTVRK